MSRWRATRNNVLLMSVAVALALGLTEVVVRAASPQPLAVFNQDRYGLALHQTSFETYLPQFGLRASFNSAGMRDREHSPEKRHGVFRILLLGDSFMEALQVPFESSFPSLLERSLQRQTSKPVEVVSAGVSGWGTDDQLRYLTNYGLQWRPDLVVITMTLHNDISDNLREAWHTVQKDSLIEQPRPAMPFITYKALGLKAFLASRFHVYQLLRRARHARAMEEVGRQLNLHVANLFRDPAPEEISRGFLLTDRLLERMQAVTKAEGAGVALVLLPLSVQQSDDRFSRFVRSAGVTDQEMPLRKPQQEMTRIGDRLGIPVVDLLPAFREWAADGGDALYLEWDGHWNEAGHRLAAKTAATGLVEAGALR